MGCGNEQSIIRQFHQEHGEHVTHNDYFYFEDGAARECSPWGHLVSPPIDPHQRAKNILIFYKVKLQNAIEEFDSLKVALERYAKYGMQEKLCPSTPPREKLDELKELSVKVKAARKVFKQAQKQVEDTIPQEIKDRLAQSEKQRSELNDYLNELNTINI